MQFRAIVTNKVLSIYITKLTQNYFDTNQYLESQLYNKLEITQSLIMNNTYSQTQRGLSKLYELDESLDTKLTELDQTSQSIPFKISNFQQQLKQLTPKVPVVIKIPSKKKENKQQLKKQKLSPQNKYKKSIYADSKRVLRSQTEDIRQHTTKDGVIVSFEYENQALQTIIREGKIKITQRAKIPVVIHWEEAMKLLNEKKRDLNRRLVIDLDFWEDQQA